jgi:hypothetical protein
MSTELQRATCLADTYKHIKRVGFFLNRMIRDLINRGEIHDDSKLEDPELEGFANASSLSDVEYGTPAYKEMLASTGLAETISHHYAKNRHHTEHWANGINDMNLLDVLEMICDWRAATERNRNGNIKTSIELNAEKYGISPQLRKIMENTARDLLQ